jgi:hypothetical protein
VPDLEPNGGWGLGAGPCSNVLWLGVAAR